jgi:hypothetical protein
MAAQRTLLSGTVPPAPPTRKFQFYSLFECLRIPFLWILEKRKIIILMPGSLLPVYSTVNSNALCKGCECLQCWQGSCATACSLPMCPTLLLSLHSVPLLPLTQFKIGNWKQWLPILEFLGSDCPQAVPQQLVELIMIILILHITWP